MSLKTGAIIKRVLLPLVLIALLLPSAISAQSTKTSGSKPTPTPVATSDNTAHINDLLEKLRNAEFEYQKALDYQQFLANTVNEYTDFNTVLQATNNAVSWLGKITGYKLELINLGYDFTSDPVSGFNNNYYTMPQNNSSTSTFHLERVTCSSCNGTGLSPIKKYPPTYGLTNTGDNHYHDVCIPCRGLGYIEKYVR